MILNLISGPRNISTALMYAFAQRTDTHVPNEPFYAVFLGVNHPGAEVVLRALPHEERTIREQIASSGFRKPVALSRPLPSYLKGLYSEAKSIYEKLRPFSLKP